MKKRLTAIKSFRYSTRAIRAGDVFDIGARDAKVLIALGRAVRYACLLYTSPSPRDS